MLIVPLRPLPNQTVTAVLGGQRTQVNVYQKATGLFVDVLVDDVPLIVGAVCQNLNRLVRSAYLGFVGDLGFVDTLGQRDPSYLGLGSRFLLMYLEASDLA